MTFTFMNMGDDFIQSDTQFTTKGSYFSLCVLPGDQTCVLRASNTIFHVIQTVT